MPYLNATAVVENFPPLNLKIHSRPNDPAIGDLDAAVICDMGIYRQPPGGRWVLSSPNASWIPEFQTNAHDVVMRADGRFYTDDRTLWPQLFCPQFEYICVIPRKPYPHVPNHPLAILWWTPTKSDFVPVDEAVLSQYNGAPEGVVLGRLKDERIARLRVYKDKCVAEAHKYTLSHGLRTLPGILEQSLRHHWARITAVPFTFREMILHVAELQRICLDIQAFLDFTNIYLPRLYMPDEQLNHLPVEHQLMGAVTESEVDLHQLVKMRIPVWHLRPSFRIPKSMNIAAVEVPIYPYSVQLESATFDNTPQRILASCGPGTERQLSMQPLGCAYLGLTMNRSQFSLSSSVDLMSQNIAPASTSSLSSTSSPAHASSSKSKVAPFSVVPSPSSSSSSFSPISSPAKVPAHMKPSPLLALTKKLSGPSRSNRSNAHKKSPVPAVKVSQPSRNKFEDLNWLAMPCSNPAWSSALRTVGEWARLNPTSITPLGYVYPEPGLIAGSDNLRRSYFMMWLARRSLILWKECDDSFKAEGWTRPQGWRDFLGGHLTHEGRSSKEALRRVELANKFIARGIVLAPYSSHVKWYNQQHSTSEDLPPAVATQVLWDLYEQNFRAEILALDRRLMEKEWASPEHCLTRDRMVQAVLFDCDTGEPGGPYIVTSVPSTDMGLASANWNVRMRFVKNLHSLMKTWPEQMPLPDFFETTEEKWFVQQEEAVARHYCACFFNIFGRAACTPHRLIPRSDCVS
ncbi:hypothetical protein H0H93_001147 [Arthromyces matolae]|nr:hypothetical protein H0H93_001147 [Arthromyces matolae]